MNRTIKEAIVKRPHYDSHIQLRPHLSVFMAAYNFARRLKILDGLAPNEYTCKIWTSEAGSLHPEPDPPDAGTEHLRRQVAPRPA